MAKLIPGANVGKDMFHEGEEVRTRRSGRLARILSSWDNGSQMLYLIQFPDAEGEAPRWVSGDMLRSR